MVICEPYMNTRGRHANACLWAIGVVYIDRINSRARIEDLHSTQTPTIRNHQRLIYEVWKGETHYVLDIHAQS